MRPYYVYVIESLDEMGRPMFYVGQTQHTPETRLEQHRRGKKYCSSCKAKHYVRGRGMRLRYELFARYNPLESRLEAERVERWLASRLRRQGYHVVGGH